VNRRELESQLLEAKERLSEVSNASHQNIDDALQRYNHALRSSDSLREILSDILPEVDFYSWYKSATATQGGMVGSARLSWPLDPSERMALQYELLQKLSVGIIDLTDFTYTFTYEKNSFDANNAAFVSRVLVPFHNDLIRAIEPYLQTSAGDTESEKQNEEPSVQSNSGIFIDPVRVAELKSISSDKYDLSRLIQYCMEIDTAFHNESFLAVAGMTRALIDHVPPIFNCRNFSEVANNYSGAKSFKDSMKHLNTSARAIGDSHLHVQIRSSEVLPTATQINFSNDLDVLLSEIVRVLKTTSE